MSSATSYTILLLLILLPLSFSQKCNPNEKKALLQFKKDLNNPHEFINWKPKTDCCIEWYGVLCDVKTNRITQLNILLSNFQLPIPASVGDLPYLESLTFYHTNFTGQIPRAISNLSNLKYLELRYNLLTGPVPPFLGNLKKLNTIYLSSNSLTGSIPASLSQLPKLTSLFLDRNKLTGSIPESFADFKQQQYLRLYLSHNKLSGPIPTKLGSANFSSFDVSTNRLEGDLSFMFGKNKSVITADFSRNKFEFDLTKIEFSENLANLYLNNNKIYGSLPLDLSSTGRGGPRMNN